MFGLFEPQPLTGPLFDLAAAQATAMAAYSNADRSRINLSDAERSALERDLRPQFERLSGPDGQRIVDVFPEAVRSVVLSGVATICMAFVSAAAPSVGDLAGVLRDRRAGPAERLVALSSLMLLVRPDDAGLRPQDDSPYWRLPRALVLLAAQDLLGRASMIGDHVHTAEESVSTAQKFLPPEVAAVVARSVDSYRQLLGMSGIWAFIGGMIDPVLAISVQNPLASLPAPQAWPQPFQPSPFGGHYAGDGNLVIPGLGGFDSRGVYVF